MRNVTKSLNFVDYYGAVLYRTLVDNAGIPGFGGPHNLNLANGANI